MKFKILRECVIESAYYKPGGTYRFISGSSTHPTYVCQLLDHGFMEHVPGKPKTIYDLTEDDECSLLCDDGDIIHLFYGPEWRKEFAMGNIFLTEKDAENERARRKAKTILLRDTKGFKLDWSNTSPNNNRWGYTVVYNHGYKRLMTNGYAIKQFPCEIWFATEEETEASIKAHPEEWKTYLGVEDK